VRRVAAILRCTVCRRQVGALLTDGPGFVLRLAGRGRFGTDPVIDLGTLERPYHGSPVSFRCSGSCPWGSNWRVLTAAVAHAALFAHRGGGGVQTLMVPPGPDSVILPAAMRPHAIVNRPVRDLRLSANGYAPGGSPMPELATSRPARARHPEPDPLAVSVDDAARMIGISHASCWRLATSGQLPTRKLGVRRLVFVRDIEAFLDSLPMATATDDAATADPA